MNELAAYIPKRLNYLDDVIQKAKNTLMNAPSGKLRATKVHQAIHYYLKDDTTSSNGKYLKLSEDPLVCSLAQKEYAQEFIRRASKEQNLLCTLRNFYLTSPLESTLESIHSFKREKIKPIVCTDEQFAEAWQKQTFEPSSLSGDEELLSDRGEIMRSKSEVLIANALNKYNLPYHYEEPLLIDGKKIRPDFTVLNVSKRQKIIWEHFGMMSDPQYVLNFTFKYSRYLANGFLPGVNFLFTVESDSVKFGTRQIETIIRGYLLP